MEALFNGHVEPGVFTSVWKFYLQKPWRAKRYFRNRYRHQRSESTIAISVKKCDRGLQLSELSYRRFPLGVNFWRFFPFLTIVAPLTVGDRTNLKAPLERAGKIRIGTCKFQSSISIPIISLTDYHRSNCYCLKKAVYLLLLLFFFFFVLNFCPPTPPWVLKISSRNLIF